ncbi:hypothetical protein NDU88_005435 [Pleurodeles waltl]|uniref:Uncharacterized protein n=1 Tax=Pleurodeles waltl TaxID=8319 RepID=A0AAV7MB73_PLEWA|nr:hypothetical protein NDU88_005435 [Pleurodeles waltl]
MSLAAVTWNARGGNAEARGEKMPASAGDDEGGEEEEENSDIGEQFLLRRREEDKEAADGGPNTAAAREAEQRSPPRFWRSVALSGALRAVLPQAGCDPGVRIRTSGSTRNDAAEGSEKLSRGQLPSVPS